MCRNLQRWHFAYLVHVISLNLKIIFSSRLFCGIDNWSLFVKVQDFLHKSCLKWNSFLSEDTRKNHFLTCKNRFCAICSNFVRLLYGLVDLHSLLSQSFDDVSWRPWKGGDKIVFLHKICTLIFLLSSF